MHGSEQVERWIPDSAVCRAAFLRNPGQTGFRNDNEKLQMFHLRLRWSPTAPSTSASRQMEERGVPKRKVPRPVAEDGEAERVGQPREVAPVGLGIVSIGKVEDQQVAPGPQDPRDLRDIDRKST